jgi:hypothetical protein
MSFTEPIDTTGYDLDSWIRFAFDHHVSEDPWYYTEEMHFVCDPQSVIVFYTRLFQNPRSHLSQYDDAQFEQGLWFVVGSQLSEWLWEGEIPLQLRLDCIDTMPVMFREFLVDHPLETACFMWWDMLRYFGDSPEPSIVAYMIRALDQILRLPMRHLQMSALHGLAHLTHESKEGIIRRFLLVNGEIDDEMREYAENAIAGTTL